MDGSSLSLILIPVVVMISLAVWLILVAYAASHPGWKHGPPSPQGTHATPPPDAQVPLPRTEIPLPRTEIPLPRTEIPLPRTEIPLPRTEILLPRTEIPRSARQPDGTKPLASAEHGR